MKHSNRYSKACQVVLLLLIFFIFVEQDGLDRHGEGFRGTLGVYIRAHAHAGTDGHFVLFIEQDFHQEGETLLTLRRARPRHAALLLLPPP